MPNDQPRARAIGDVACRETRRQHADMSEVCAHPIMAAGVTHLGSPIDRGCMAFAVPTCDGDGTDVDATPNVKPAPVNQEAGTVATHGGNHDVRRNGWHRWLRVARYRDGRGAPCWYVT